MGVVTPPHLCVPTDPTAPIPLSPGKSPRPPHAERSMLGKDERTGSEVGAGAPSFTRAEGRTVPQEAYAPNSKCLGGCGGALLSVQTCVCAHRSPWVPWKQVGLCSELGKTGRDRAADSGGWGLIRARVPNGNSADPARRDAGAGQVRPGVGPGPRHCVSLTTAAIRPLCFLLCGVWCPNSNAFMNCNQVPQGCSKHRLVQGSS